MNLSTVNIYRLWKFWNEFCRRRGLDPNTELEQMEYFNAADF